MKVELLIVSGDDLPEKLRRSLDGQGIKCHFSRGPLKTGRILKDQEIDTIAWLNPDFTDSLSFDLIRMMNRFSKIPVVVITYGQTRMPCKVKIASFFGIADIQDDPEEILHLIERGCNHYRIDQDAKSQDKGKREIEFKNLVSHMVEEKKEPEEITEPEPAPEIEAVGTDDESVVSAAETASPPPRLESAGESEMLKLDTPWNIVGNAEKQMIANLWNSEKPEKKPALLGWLQKG